MYIKVVVFNATFKNISVISWRTVLLEDEIGTTDMSQDTNNLYHISGDTHRLQKPYGHDHDHDCPHNTKTIRQWGNTVEYRVENNVIRTSFNLYETWYYSRCLPASIAWYDAVRCTILFENFLFQMYSSVRGIDFAADFANCSLAFRCYGAGLAWWGLFQKRVVRTKYDIYVFIICIFVFSFNLLFTME